MNLKKAAQKKLKKSGGFTLVEMLIVVAIIVILVVVSIPMISGSLNEAREATDAANERAAKSAALIEYMMDPPDGDGPHYYAYDAATGSVGDAMTSATSPSVAGYNQVVDTTAGKAKKNGSAVIVKITVDATNSTTTAEASWEAVAEPEDDT